ncbi:MAG: endonuclease/exonuclease/phosphatase family protein [Gemmataceae bacterium]
MPPGPKFDYKLRWLERFAARAAELVGSPDPVVLAGDYNVIPEELDVYNPAGWEVDAPFRPEIGGGQGRGRPGVDGLVAPEPASRCSPSGTTRPGRRRNAGLRIDHLLLNRRRQIG